MLMMSEIIDEIKELKKQIYIIAEILLEKKRYAQLNPDSLNKLNKIIKLNEEYFK